MASSRKKTVKKVAKKAAKKSSKKASKQASRKASKKAAKKAAKKAGHKAVRKSGKQAAKKAGKQAARKAAKKSALKTQPDAQVSVDDYLKSLNDPQKEADARKLIALFRRQTGHQPRIWGTSMIGFGSYHYRYASGREGDMFIAGFAPRAANLVIYILAGFTRYPEIMQRLGRYKTGKGCLYLKRLDDVDASVLAELSQTSIDYMRANYECI